jgi:hypothetical protein
MFLIVLQQQEFLIGTKNNQNCVSYGKNIRFWVRH